MREGGGAGGISVSALPPASPGAPHSSARPSPPPAGAAPAASGPGRGRSAESFAVPGRAMGFDPSRFAGPVAAELQCGLCGRVLEEPLSTPCGHVFCAGCLLPWAARRRRCPLRCRPLAAAELRPVLPLRSLVQKLEVKCDYSPRGCGRTVRLRELPAHLAACRFGPPGPAEPQPRAGHPSPGSSAGQPRAGDGHRCLRALRGGGAPEPGHELKREALRWSRREKSLLAQLSALQSEVQRTARRYQAKFGQYMSHISSIARDLAGSQPGKVSAARDWSAPLQLCSPPTCFSRARLVNQRPSDGAMSPGAAVTTTESGTQPDPSAHPPRGASCPCPSLASFGEIQPPDPVARLRVLFLLIFGNTPTGDTLHAGPSSGAFG